MYLIAFPLLIIPFVLYNMIAFLLGLDLNTTVFTVSLLSGKSMPISAGDILVLIGVFGAEAAARAAFGKSAGNLSTHEAALLAAILPNPQRRSARLPTAGVRRLAGIYQARAARGANLADCVRGPGAR